MKKILALLLAAMMVLSMVACGEEKGPAGTTNTDANFTIKVWADQADQAEGNNWLVKMEDEFKKAYPQYANVKFENVTMGEGDAASAVIQDVTASADVFMFANDQIGKLVKAGGLTKLVGDYQKQLLDNNTQFMIDTVTFEGNYYAFPVTNNTWFLYYDKTVFSEDDIKSLDTMISKAKVHLPFTNAWTAPALFLGCGGTMFGANGQDVAAGIAFGAEDGGYKAAKKMVELANHENVSFGDLDISKMVSGEVSATFSGSWVRGDLEAKFGDNLGVAMLPKFTVDGEEFQMKAMSGSKCVGVNPNSAKVEGKQAAATAFAAFLASEEAQLARFEMRGMIPAHKNLAKNEKVMADKVAKAEIETINGASAIQPLVAEMDTQFWTPMGNFAGKVGTKDITMESYEIAVDEMMEAMNP